MKKLIYALALVCLIATILAFAAFADTDGDWKYEDYGCQGGVTITEYIFLDCEL